MAFGGVVQTAEATVASGTVTVSFSAATAGNLLIFVVGRSTTMATGTTWGTPSGWVGPVQATPNLNTSGNMAGAMYYKVAAGGETSVTSTESSPPGNGRGIVIEYEGPFDGSTPLDVSAEDESALLSAVTSITTGTTGTTAQNDELAVAVFATDAASTWDTGRSYTNSFVEDIFASASTSPGRPACIAAHRVLTTTGAYTTTLTTTDTGDEAYGSIATFKKAASGGTEYEQDNSGGVTPSGTANRVISTAKTGAVTTAGGIARTVATAKTGTLTSAGALTAVKTALVDAAGTLTAAGALIRQTALVRAGTLTSAGALVKQTVKAFTGTLTTAGALDAVKTALVNVAGTLSSAGAIVRQTALVRAGTLTAVGATIKQTAKTFAGVLTSAGVLGAVKTALVSVAGTLSSVGALIRQTDKQTAGTLSPVGAITRSIARALTGTLTSIGALIRQASGSSAIEPGARGALYVNPRRTGETAERETHRVDERETHGD